MSEFSLPVRQILQLQRNMNTLLTLWFLLSSAVCLHGLTVGDVTEVYRWVSVDYDWPNATTKTDYITNNLFILENNIIAGIKVYRDEVYVTVPRWRRGIPSSLNRVVTRGDKHLLQPYPSWAMHRLGDCSVLQYVQSMEIDPNTGYMYILDNGRINIFENSSTNVCPPKLLIWNMQKNAEVHRYVFPADVADPTSCFLNDIVLDYVDGHVAFAYITDVLEAKLYVYDYNKDESYVFKDPSMQPESPGGYAVDGIAMSPTFDFVYFCPITGRGLYQIPTSVLRDRHAQFGQHVRRVGTLLSRADGLAYGQQNLYFGLLDLDGLARWEVAGDAKDGCYSSVNMVSQKVIASNNITMRWVDTLAWDDRGYLWFVANDINRYLSKTMNFTGSEPNMYITKVFVNESSYLSTALSPVRPQCTSSGARSSLAHLATWLLLFTSLLLI